jgi:MinD superfamily P-loop ATPase
MSGKAHGKTLISRIWPGNPANALFDCDVEEPNGKIFFKPENPAMVEVTTKFRDRGGCNGCGKCVDFCD